VNQLDHRMPERTHARVPLRLLVLMIKIRDLYVINLCFGADSIESQGVHLDYDAAAPRAAHS
jgi:hypothetical protein